MSSLENYDFVELEIEVEKPNFENPFTDVKIKGEFWQEENESISVEGFCDSKEGSVYKVRFMPREAGEYQYRIEFNHTNGVNKQFTGSIQAEESHRKGILKTDSDNPYHFQWENTGEHYFLNGTTTYYFRTKVIPEPGFDIPRQ